MSTVVTFVSSPTAAKAIDEKTLVIKSTCGLLATYNFVNKETMKAVALEILSAVENAEPEPEPEPEPETPTLAALDLDTSAGSETEYEPPSEAESSFESYTGSGLTQEAQF